MSTALADRRFRPLGRFAMFLALNYLESVANDDLVSTIEI